jgi:phosphoglycerate dehydrogenase-like enzyme
LAGRDRGHRRSRSGKGLSQFDCELGLPLVDTRSLQLVFLLAQGSEFAFVILSLPAVRALLGPVRVSIVVASVVLSLALTPNLAEIGRQVAGQLRRRKDKVEGPELQRKELAAPVLIIGMGRIGRTLADGLTKFDIQYNAVERDQAG